MGHVHIFVAPIQRATRYRVEVLGRNMIFRNPPHRAIHCRKCRRKRWAQHLTVQAYYDGHYYFCAPGHGCKKKKR